MPGQDYRHRLSRVLPGNYVLDVMYQLAVPLVKPAIFAPLSSPFTDEPPGSGIHR
jgi:hypothetical protein